MDFCISTILCGYLTRIFRAETLRLTFAFKRTHKKLESLNFSNILLVLLVFPLVVRYSYYKLLRGIKKGLIRLTRHWFNLTFI